jgi:hypothetical protein
MYHVFDNLQTPKRFVAGAKVTVYVVGTSTKAALYADQGVTQISNPVTTGPNGQFDFYVADGHYDFAFSGGSPAIQDLRISDIALVSSSSSSPESSGLIAKTITIPSIAAGASLPVVITWDTPFASDVYTVTYSVECPVSGGLALRGLHIESKTASQVTIRVVNDDDVNAHAGLLHAYGVQS